jgi:RNA-directed DNA polymerase
LEENLQKRPHQSDEERVQDFQRKLYLKAKQDKEFRFYVLYDKIRTRHFLQVSYKKVKSSGGAPGCDGVTFARIESEGLDQFIDGIIKELETKTYKPQPVRRVNIPKSDGKQRPLGIPTIRDRVVQMSCKLVIEPIFEADFESSSYGFRPKRDAKGAITEIKKELEEGKTEIYDADISSFFDTIPHDKLLITVGKRISDKNVLHLLKLWLKSPVIDENNRMSGGKKTKTGAPQGGVISPLLANIYLNLLDRIVNKVGSLYNQMGIKIIRYADDFVLMGKRIPLSVQEKTESILARMGLKLNAAKTKVVEATEESFDFLGFTIRYDKDLYKGKRKYWNIIPSEKSNRKIRKAVKEVCSYGLHDNPEILAGKLNQKLRGWINYYTITGVSYPAKAKRKLTWHVKETLYRYYKRKSQRKSKLYRQGAFEILVDKYGLIDPSKYHPKTFVNA